MEIKWNYLTQNICSGEKKPVAIMSKKDGTVILEVFEHGDRHVIKLSSAFKFITPIEVTYKQESKLITTPTNLDNYIGKILLSRLEVCCKLVEEDFNQQIAAIERALL